MEKPVVVEFGLYDKVAVPQISKREAVSQEVVTKVDDFKINYGDNVLHFRDQPDQGAALKNGVSSERNGTIDPRCSCLRSHSVISKAKWCAGKGRIGWLSRYERCGLHSKP
jgi:hypothetical protein